MALAWTAFAIYGSLVPLAYRPVAWEDAVDRFRNLPPLWVGIGTRADWVANILLFIPLSFLWLGAAACDRGRLARVVAAVAVMPLATFAAVALEFTQIWFARRTVSRNDILAETIGAGIGVVVWLAIGQRVVAWVRTWSTDRRPQSRVQWLLQAYFVGFTLWSVIPLDLTISLTELYHKWQRGQVVLVPFAYHYESWSTQVYQSFGDLMVFVPVGIWVGLFNWQGKSRGAAIRMAAVAGALYGSAVEFLQLLVLSRYTDTTDILFAVAGSMLGAWAITWWKGTGEPAASGARRQAPTAWPTLGAIAAYSAFLAAGFLFPFEVTHDRTLIAERLQGFTRVPLFSLYMGTEFNAIQQVLVRLLLFAPLGALWGMLLQRVRGSGVRVILTIVGLLYSAGLATTIEVAQVLMPGKIADMTDAIICAIGALGGLYLATGPLSSRAVAEGSGGREPR